jgi:integrase
VIAWIGDRKGAFFPSNEPPVNRDAQHDLPSSHGQGWSGTGRHLPGGIEARRSFHCLRHSFTSWLAEADVPSDVRRKLTGHKSIGVHDLYTHHDESLRRAIKELPDLTSQNNSETKNE